MSDTLMLVLWGVGGVSVAAAIFFGWKAFECARASGAPDHAHLPGHGGEPATSPVGSPQSRGGGLQASQPDPLRVPEGSHLDPWLLIAYGGTVKLR